MADSSEHDGIRKVIEREMFRLRSTYGPEALPVSSSLALSALQAGALKGKVVLVTGGTKGARERDHAIETYGRIDVVVANAGVFETGSFLDDEVDADGKLMKPDFGTITINVLGTLFTSRLAFHHLRKNDSVGSKALIILGSLTSFVATPGCPLYATSKHALLGLQRALHAESEADGISVTFVASGPVPTDIFGPLRPMIEQLPHIKLSDTVDAMLFAASNPSEEKLGGCTLATDTAGIFRIPFVQAYRD
ncbi:hypothetical protein JCM8208_000226 [Rhodotorula glutinis]